MQTHALKYDYAGNDRAGERWTPADITRLREAWVDTSIPREDLPRVLRRSDDALTRMAVILGLGRRPVRRRMQPHEWREEELDKLRKGWNVVALPILAKDIGRTQSACEKKAGQLRLPYRTGAAMAVARALYPELLQAAQPKRVALIDRKCLCCQREFQAPTKFLRMCEPCRKAS